MDPHRLTLPHVEFHNIVAPEPWDFGAGWLLPRYPRSVREVMNEKGRLTSREATGVEIRFVTASPNVRLYLSSPDNDTEVMIFAGDFLHSTHKLATGVKTSILINPPERFREVTPDILRQGMFAPNVWRVVGTRSSLVLHGLDSFGHLVRPPHRDEKPRLKWLAYGSSITHSSWKGYPQQAAWRLGVDVLNKGLSGSCHFEPSTADFLAREVQWDFATLELGINVRGHMPPEEFTRRARYMVEEFAEAKPGCLVALITVYPNFSMHREEVHNDYRNELAYNDILRGLAQEFADRNVRLIEGSDVLQEFSGLGIDLLHPTEFGHVRMGENLAAALKPLLAMG